MILVLAENATTGCTNWMYNTLTISVNQPVPVSITISASNNPSAAGQDVTFTALPVNGVIRPPIPVEGKWLGCRIKHSDLYL